LLKLYSIGGSRGQRDKYLMIRGIREGKASQKPEARSQKKEGSS
jgi:hypothetical protein